MPVDGFRIDAVKHMRFTFYSDWLDTLRREAREELFAVGEYWNGDVNALNNYIDTTKGALSLFDVPLHFRFVDEMFIRDRCRRASCGRWRNGIPDSSKADIA